MDEENYNEEYVENEQQPILDDTSTLAVNYQIERHFAEMESKKRLERWAQEHAEELNDPQVSTSMKQTFADTNDPVVVADMALNEAKRRNEYQSQTDQKIESVGNLKYKDEDKLTADEFAIVHGLKRENW
jgi:hypothetical protein